MQVDGNWGFDTSLRKYRLQEINTLRKILALSESVWKAVYFTTASIPNPEARCCGTKDTSSFLSLKTN